MNFKEFIANQHNEQSFPILFIGSGITKRYLETPSWDDLLKKFWNKTSKSKNTYYAEYDILNDRYEGDTFKIYTELAYELEREYNIEFFNGDENLQKESNLSPEVAHTSHISPFKMALANYFSEKIEGLNEQNYEFDLFIDVLKKANTIITTNYDQFLEKSLNDDTQCVFKGIDLKNLSKDRRVLLKIHGSVEDPNSMVLTKNDYKKLNNSYSGLLITSEIMERLRSSTILFLGYSLTDHDVQAFLKTVFSGLEFSNEDMLKRIAFINYKKGQREIEDKIEITNNNIPITVFETDNYSDIYNQLLTLKPVTKLMNGFQDQKHYGIFFRFGVDKLEQNFSLEMDSSRIFEYTDQTLINSYSDLHKLKDIPWIVGGEYSAPQYSEKNILCIAQLQSIDKVNRGYRFSFKKIADFSWKFLYNHLEKFEINDGEIRRTHVGVKFPNLYNLLIDLGK